MKLKNPILLCLTINRIFPLDKILLILYVFYSFITKNYKLSPVSQNLLKILWGGVSFSFIINIFNANFSIFYPLIFLTGALMLANEKGIELENIRKVIFINILFGLLAVAFALLGFENEYSFSLREKALPFLYAPYGMSPTLQVYGTFCNLYILLSFEMRKQDMSLFLSILAVLITFNRCSLLFFLLLLCLYKTRVFKILLSVLLAIIIYFWDVIRVIFFSTTTLDSRSELREPARISFWNSSDWSVYLFGRGSTEVADNIANQTYYSHTYIENGLDFILHSYGFIGLFIYLLMIIVFVRYLIKSSKYKLIFIVLYYFLFEQMLTHEFLASSVFFFILINLLLTKNNSQNVIYKYSNSNL